MEVADLNKTSNDLNRLANSYTDIGWIYQELGNFDPEQSDSLGMELVVGLTSQIDGILELEKKLYTKFRIVFPRL